MSTRNPTTAEVLRTAIDAALASLHSCMPARIVRYDASKQLVDVKPLLQVIYYDEEGARQTAALPVICNVPVAFPQGGGYALTFPVKADSAGSTDGDLCVLVFSDLSTDKWLSGSGQEIDPQFDHSHALTDAVALLGIKTFGSPLSDAPTDRVRLSKQGGTKIDLMDGAVTVDASASGNTITLKGDGVTVTLSSGACDVT